MSDGDRWLAVLCVASALLAPAAAWAQDAAATDGAVELETVTVTADGDPEAAVSATTTLDKAQIDTELQPDSIPQMLTTMPGVTTATQPDSPATSINIRGLQDFGRVNVTVDGARQNFQVSGHAANGTFYLDPEMVQQVDVMRGAGSAIDGTGAIAGGVAFTTLDAGSVLRPDQTFGGLIKTRFSTNNNQLMEHGEVAGRVGDAFDVIAAGTWNKQPNYFDGQGNVVSLSSDELVSGLVKARFRPSEGEEVTASVLQYQDKYDVGAFSSTTKATTADVGTYALGYRWDDPDNELIDLRSNVYYTTTSTDQVIVKDDAARGRGGLSRVGERRSFEIGTFGGDANNKSTFDTGPVQHNVTVGADFYRDAVESSGFDAETTPPGQRFVYGTFARDRMKMGMFELIPAVRYDAYELSSRNIENEGSRLSPKITASVTPIDPVTLFVSYSEAFRPPTLTETLIDATHPGGVNFPFLPNPNLRGEVAHELQAGLDLRFNDLARAGDRFQARIVGYRNVVDDYIELTSIPDPDPLKPSAYQYRNIAQGKLWGAELEANYDAGVMFFGLAGTYVRGINEETRERLSTIPGDRIVGTLGGRMMDGRLVMGTRISRVAAVEDPPPQSPYPPTEAYSLFDLFASAQINDRFSLALNIDNLFDRQYTQFLNVLASPGRNAKFTATLRF